jgi:chondroitin 4-sulfotransferase 11
LLPNLSRERWGLDEDPALYVPARPVRYLTDKNGEVLVDFIGRFENFGQDLSHVFDMLGLEVSQLEIPHENRSAHSHYSEMYTPETRKIVRERFRKDIEFFGYEFETAPRQVVR